MYHSIKVPQRCEVVADRDILKLKSETSTHHNKCTILDAISLQIH